MPRLAVLCEDAIGERMAGPAMRALELSRALSGVAEVLLVGRGGGSLDVPGVATAELPDDTSVLPALVEDADAVLVIGPYILERTPGLRFVEGVLVVDLYDPFLFSDLEYAAGQGAVRAAEVARVSQGALRTVLTLGDFFICASERQRDFWLGALAALGRLWPSTYGRDPSLRSLIDVVPFGLPSSPPAAGGRVLKGVHPQVGEGDVVLLWGGGVWDWMDAATPVRALAVLARRGLEAKLVFMGVNRPLLGTSVASRALKEVWRAVEEEGVGERVVFLDWVPYKERAGYLLEADVGLVAHREGMEARLAYRTRVLDYIWAKLPVVTTWGDVLSEKVEREGLGEVVRPGDAEAMAKAVEALLDPARRGEVVKRMEEVAAELTWERVSAPLRLLLEDPSRVERSPYRPPPLPALRPLSARDVGEILIELEERGKLLVAEKDLHIDNLKAMVAEKDLHIDNLKAMVAEKDAHIGKLASALAASNKRGLAVAGRVFRRAFSSLRGLLKRGGGPRG